MFLTNQTLEKEKTVRIVVGKERLEGVKPKVDHNINIAGLLVTDADTVLGKLEREKEGPLKGLYVLPKSLGDGTVYICNGAEFPNAEAVDLLLYLLYVAEKHDWPRKVEIPSLNALAKEVFGIRQSGKYWNEKIERALVIWANHKFYFKNCFSWRGEIIDTVMLGIIQSFKIERYGKGKPAVLTITFDDDFIEVCKNTEWYRRPSWLEVKKLRKEVAKSLYLLAFEFKPNEKVKSWKIYINEDLKYWYRNALNSLANPKYLRPAIVLKRLRRAIEEINQKTSLWMDLRKTEGGNYCIVVEEVGTREVKELEAPFDKLSERDKAILKAYVEAVAEENKIESVFGFLRSMTAEQIDSWLGKAKKYFGSKVEIVEETKLVEEPKLIEFLRNWGNLKYSDKPNLYKLYFGEGRIIKAYKNNRKVVFVCLDRVLAQLLSKFSGELKEIFKKEVVFVGQEEGF